MTTPIPIEEHLDRIRRVQSMTCPRCGAGKGEACRGPKSDPADQHHAARYGKLYRQRAGRP